MKPVFTGIVSILAAITGALPQLTFAAEAFSPERFQKDWEEARVFFVAREDGKHPLLGVYYSYKEKVCREIAGDEKALSARPVACPKEILSVVGAPLLPAIHDFAAFTTRLADCARRREAVCLRSLAHPRIQTSSQGFITFEDPREAWISSTGLEQLGRVLGGKLDWGKQSVDGREARYLRSGSLTVEALHTPDRGWQLTVQMSASRDGAE